jgi:hypothetical protein
MYNTTVFRLQLLEINKILNKIELSSVCVKQADIPLFFLLFYKIQISMYRNFIDSLQNIFDSYSSFMVLLVLATLQGYCMSGIFPNVKGVVVRS